MVHFASKLEVINRPATPPVCPKCGSHRTEVIGKADDPNNRTIRCIKCGTISSVPVSQAEAFIAGATSAA